MQKTIEIKKIYPLTPMQEGMLFHSIVDENSYSYLTQLSFSLQGKLIVNILEKSFNTVIERYDILRTVFNYDEAKQPIQIVIREREAKIYWEDISLKKEDEKSSFLEEYARKDMDKGFDLTKDLLMRVSVFKTENDVHRVIITLHHIVLDGWCLGLVVKEIFQIYDLLKEANDLKKEAKFDLEPVYPYSKYVSWLEKHNKEEAGLFWREYLSGYEQQTTIPKTKVKHQKTNIEHLKLKFTIDSELTRGLLELAMKNRVTLNTVFQTIWGILLKRYNNTDDVVFGSVISGRHFDLPGIEKMVGLFINTIPVRIKFNNNISFNELIMDVQRSALKAQKYSYYPLAKIQKDTELKQGLIDHIVAFENLPIEEELGGLENKNSFYGFRIFDMHSFGQTNYDFNLIVVPGKDLKITIEYDENGYEKNFLDKIEGHFRQIARSIIENPNIRICDIDIVSPDEKKQLLFDFNDTLAEYPREMTIHKLFEKQVERNPEKIAVVYKERGLTYEELNVKANQIARKLRRQGVKEDCIVGIVAERSLEMIIGILAILKAGGAYLPISPDYPGERINYTLNDSGTFILLTQKAIHKEIFSHSISIINLDDDELYMEDGSNIENIATPNNAAYVIYTSGTTGKPKGTIIEHKNVVRLLFNDKMYFDFNENDIWSMFHSFCFDFSVWEMYGALLYGGKLIIVPKQTTLDPQSFLMLLKNERVTILNQVPSSFYNIIREEANFSDNRLELRYVIFGGEALKPAMLKPWKRKYPYTKLINMYGITETTVHVTFKEITDYEIAENKSNIGKAIPTLTTYIMDRDMKLLPIGVEGELYVGGEGLGREYLNRIELTTQKFIQNPYKKGERIYKSGDLVKMLYNGDMEYIGRTDHQVKIRGFRIELGEIESQILKCNSINEVIVIPKKDSDGNQYICAYIVSPKGITVQELRKNLLKILPDYMVPAYFVQLDSIPLTSNGKVDRKALPEPLGNINLGVDYMPAQNRIQEILVDIWQEVLGLSKIGINDNFFACGGDSIKALQISARIKKYKLKVEIRDLFQHSTISELSSYIKSYGNKPKQESVVGEIMLTPIQKRFFEIEMPVSNHFNQSAVIYNSEGFNGSVIQRVFTYIVQHHDALRMKYVIDGKKILQINGGIEGCLFEFKEFNLKNTSEYEKQIEFEANKIQSSINLETGPLVKLALFKTSHGDYLFIAIHHLVIDGVSWRIILEDFESAYMQCINNQEITLQDKTDSFRDWAEKVADYSNSKKLLEQIDYWRAVESMEVISIPKDYDIVESKFKNSKDISLEISKEDTQKLLQEVNKAYNTELIDILVVALGMAIKEWSGQDKILINMEGHGREDIIEEIDISRTVGWFTSVYPVLIDMTGPKDKLEKEGLGYFIKHIKESLRQVPKRGIGYGILRYVTTPENRQKLDFRLKPEICFNYLGQFGQEIKRGVFELSDIGTGMPINPENKRQHVLEISGMIKRNNLILNFNYDTNQYEEHTVIKLAEGYKSCLEKLVSHCTSKGKTEITPADMTFSMLSIEELDDLVEEVSNIL